MLWRPTRLRPTARRPAFRLPRHRPGPPRHRPARPGGVGPGHPVEGGHHGHAPHLAEARVDGGYLRRVRADTDEPVCPPHCALPSCRCTPSVTCVHSSPAPVAVTPFEGGAVVDPADGGFADSSVPRPAASTRSPAQSGAVVPIDEHAGTRFLDRERPQRPSSALGRVRARGATGWRRARARSRPAPAGRSCDPRVRKPGRTGRAHRHGTPRRWHTSPRWVRRRRCTRSGLRVELVGMSLSLGQAQRARPSASIATYFSMRRARVSGLLASATPRVNHRFWE